MKVVVTLKLKRKDVEERSKIQLTFLFSISSLCNQCYTYHILIYGKGNSYKWAGTHETAQK